MAAEDGKDHIEAATLRIDVVRKALNGAVAKKIVVVLVNVVF